MNFPKFVNKKIVIFVVLFIAFILFSGFFNVMREGLSPDVKKIIKGMDCSGCHISLNDPKCNKRCPKLNYKDFITRFDGEVTKYELKPKKLSKQVKNLID